MRALLRKHWPLLGIVAVLLVTAIFLLRSRTGSIGAMLLQDLFLGKGLRLQNIHYTQDDPQKDMRWVLDAREVEMSKDRERITFKDFQLLVEPRDRPWIKLTGKRGRYSKGSGEISLQGDLEGTTENGYRFLTERLLIQERQRLVHGDGRVQVFGPFFSVAGTGLFVDLGAETVRILSTVTTVVKGGTPS